MIEEQNGMIYYHIPVDAYDCPTFYLSFNLSKMNIEKFFSRQEIPHFQTHVLNPLVHDLIKDFSKLELKEFNDELEKSWYVKLVNVYPRFKNNNHAMDFMYKVMGEIYDKTEIKFKKENEEERKYHETPEMQNFIAQCRKLMEYTSKLGKDFFFDGDLAGRYLIENDEFDLPLRCNSFYKRIKIPQGVEVALVEESIHYIVFDWTAERPDHLKAISNISQYLKNNFAKYLKVPVILSTNLNWETRQKVIKKIIDDGLPEHLEISRDRTKVINWETRIRFLDMEAKQNADNSGYKKMNCNVYQDWITDVAEEYKNWTYGKPLKDAYKPDDILENTETGEKKTWKMWYKDILELSKKGKSNGTLNDLFKILKKEIKIGMKTN